MLTKLISLNGMRKEQLQSNVLLTVVISASEF